MAEIIEREFELDPHRSVDKRKTEPDRFGYHALNYICCHAKKRLADVEYKKYAGVWCEIQVTSILRHAWSEIEHEWYDLKEAYPDEIKRRFFRLVGVFELVESEFIDLKKKRSDYQKSMDLQVEAEVPELALDFVSMKSLVTHDALIAKLDRAICERNDMILYAEVLDPTVALVASAATCAGLSTVNQVRDSLKKYENALLEYVERTNTRSPTARRRYPRLTIMRGISILELAFMLIGQRSEGGLLNAMEKVYGVKLTDDMAKIYMAHAAIAREILSKYAPPTDTHH